MKLSQPSPPSAMVAARIILWYAKPRAIVGDGGASDDIPVYISAPISRQAAPPQPFLRPYDEGLYEGYIFTRLRR